MKLKLLFKNVTKYNSKTYNDFINFHNERFGTSYNIYTIVMTILLVYCVILNIVQKNWLFIIFFLLLLIGFLIFRLYLPVKRYKKTKKEYSNKKENFFTFSFYDWFFTLNDTTFYYFKLYKAFETKDCFYLYINEDTAVMVNKNGFKIGTSEEFSKFIKKKCFFKYSKKDS